MKRVLVCVIGILFLGLKTPEDKNSVVFTKENSEYYKETCKDVCKNYYGDLGNLFGKSTTPEQKYEISNSIKEEFFLDDARIEKDLDTLVQPDYKAADYFDRIASIYGQLDDAELVPVDTNIQISDIYYVNGKYVIVATVERNIVIKNAKKANSSLANKKTQDIYFTITPDRKLKIYSIQHYRENKFSGYQPITLVSSSVTSNNSEPFFQFDVQPLRAKINIDEKSVTNDGGKIPTTIGNHTIEITAKNYQPIRFDINVSDNGEQKITRALLRKNGYLAVNSQNENMLESEVYIDKDMVGNIPLTNYQLPVGSHDIEIKGKDNFYKFYHVTITDENVTTLNIEEKSKAKWQSEKNANYSPQATDVSYEKFYTELSPHGQWVADPQYGNVWVPNESIEGDDFRPYYSNGHWAMTDNGNTWLSEDSWGWACYHYGRWTYNSFYGWVWVPGYEWAPAWVTWRLGNDYCGWAPLAPGLSIGVSNRCPDTWWVFVEPRHIYSSGYSKHWRGTKYNRTYIQQTTVVNNIYVDNHTRTRYYFGPRSSTIERLTHKPVQVYRISQTNNPGSNEVRNQTVNIYRPNLRSQSPRQILPTYVIPASTPIRPQEISSSTTQNQYRFRQQVQQIRTTYRPQQHSQTQTTYRPQQQPQTQTTYRPQQQQQTQTTYRPQQQPQTQTTYRPQQQPQTQTTYRPQQRPQTQTTYRAQSQQQNNYTQQPQQQNNYRSQPQQQNNYRSQPQQQNNYTQRPQQQNNYTQRPQQQNNHRSQPQQQNNYRSQPQQQNNYTQRPQQQNNYRSQPQQQNNYRSQPQQQNNYTQRPQQQNNFRSQPQQQNNYRSQPQQQNNQHRR